MGKKQILFLALAVFSNFLLAPAAIASSSGASWQALLDQMEPDISSTDTDQLHLRASRLPRPYKTSSFYSQHVPLDLSPVGVKRNVGLDFSDYVTDDESRRGNGNSNSGEGGRRRYWRNG